MENPATLITALRDKIRRHERLYYVESNPEISDGEFDRLLEQLQSLEKAHPELITPDSPTQRIGEALTSFNSIKHRVPMLSIENSYSESDISEWVVRLEKLLNRSIFPVVAELKIDGVSGSFNYCDGLLVSGATRGNGIEGDLVTENIRTIKSLPLKIKTTFDIDVRGEIYTPRSRLEELNRIRINDGEEPFKNCRNLTSGTIKSLDPSVVAQRGLQVMVYGIAQARELGFKSHSETLSFLAEQGFKLNHAWALCQNISEIASFIDDISKKRANFDFDIDGVVIKIDNLTLQEESGTTSKAPRWAIAYKYPQERAVSKLLNVEWQIGRSQLTPVAHLEPVELGGTTVSRASLHNLDQIKEKDIRIGDQVLVEKAGYIIPYIVEALPAQRSGNEIPIEPPTHCPACNERIVVVSAADEETATVVRCKNPFCHGVIARRITHFITQLEIENFGPQLIDRLIENGVVSSVEGILTLEVGQLANLERMGEKSATKIIAGIKAASQKPLGRLISALGIANVGTVVSDKIAAWFNHSFSAFITANLTELIKIEGIKEKVAQSIVDFFANPLNIPLIETLKTWWVGPTKEELGKLRAGNQLDGKAFVVTGEAVLPRRQIEELIKSYGGTVKSSVSAKTSYLLIGSQEGDNFVSTKKNKAEQHKVPVINEHELFDILGLKIENTKNQG